MLKKNIFLLIFNQKLENINKINEFYKQLLLIFINKVSKLISFKRL